MRIQRIALEHHRHSSCPGRQVVHHPIADQNVAGGWTLETPDHAKQSGLATPRRTKEHQELTIIGLQIDAIDGGGARLAEILRQFPRFYSCHRVPLWLAAYGTFVARCSWRFP